MPVNPNAKIYFGTDQSGNSNAEVYYNIRLAQINSNEFSSATDSSTIYDNYLNTSNDTYAFCNKAWKGWPGSTNGTTRLFSLGQHQFVEAAPTMNNPTPLAATEDSVFYPAVEDSTSVDYTTIDDNYYFGNSNISTSINTSYDVYLAFIVGGCGIIPESSNNVESEIERFYFDVINSNGNAGSGSTGVQAKDNLPIITNAASSYRGTVSFRNCGNNSYISAITSSGTQNYSNGTDSSADFFLEDGTVLKYDKMYSYTWKYNREGYTGGYVSTLHTSFGPSDSDISNVADDWRRFICVILYKVVNHGILNQLSLKYSPTATTLLYTQLSQSSLLNTLRLNTFVTVNYHGTHPTDPDNPGFDPILHASNPNSSNGNLNEESDSGDYHILGAGETDGGTYYFVTSKCADFSGSSGSGMTIGTITNPNLLHDINYYFGITMKATKYDFNYKYSLYLNSILPYSEDDRDNGTYYIGKSFPISAPHTRNLNFYFLQDYKKADLTEDYESTSCSSCVLELIPEEGTGISRPGHTSPANKNADVSDISTGQGCVFYNSSKPFDFVFPLNYKTSTVGGPGINNGTTTTTITEKINYATSFFGALKYLNIESPLSGSVDSSVCWSQSIDNGMQDVCSYTINVPAVNQTIDLSNLSATHTPFGYTQSWKFVVKPLVGLPEEISEFTTEYNINCHFLYYGADLPYTQSAEAINTINDYSGFDVSTGEDEFGNEIDDKYMALTGTVLNNTQASLIGRYYGLYDSSKNVPLNGTGNVSNLNLTNRVLNSTLGQHGVPDASTDIIRKYSAPIDDSNPSNTDENMCIRKRYVPFEAIGLASFADTGEINNEIYKIWPGDEETVSHESEERHLLCTFSGTISTSSSNISYSES